MLRDLNATYAGRRILASPYVGILASQIAAETAVGDSGQGILYNEAIDPAYAGKYLRAWITNPPTTGSLTVAENGQVEAYDLPDGVHVFDYDVIVDDVYESSTSFTVQVGVGSAVASGGTGTSVGSGSGGEPSTATNTIASGGVGTGVGSGSGGGVVAGVSATAPGGIGTSTGNGKGGMAYSGELTAIRVKVGGVYVPALAFSKVNGAYQPVSGVFVKRDGQYVSIV